MSLAIRHRGRPGAPVIVLVKLLRDEGLDVRLADAKAEFQTFNAFDSAHLHDIAQMAADIETIIKLPAAAAGLIESVRRAVAAFLQRHPDHEVEIIDDNDDLAWEHAKYGGPQNERYTIVWLVGSKNAHLRQARTVEEAHGLLKEYRAANPGGQYRILHTLTTTAETWVDVPL